MFLYFIVIEISKHDHNQGGINGTFVIIFLLDLGFIYKILNIKFLTK